MKGMTFLIFHWVHHPQLRNHEKLMCILYDCGMATVDQLVTITGWSNALVRKSLLQISWMGGKDSTTKDHWIKRTQVGRVIVGQAPSAYYLGIKGNNYALMINQNETSKRESSPSQVFHYLGTNDVFTRLIEAGFDREDLVWNSPHECIAMIYSLWERRVKNLDLSTLKKLSRPDARLSIGDQAYWIEFDNDTEGSRKLEKKYQRYVNTISPYKYDFRMIHDTPLKRPVVWVTISEKRKIFLENLWKATRKSIYKDYGDDQLPTMLFFNRGDDTNYIIERFNEANAL